MAVVTLVEVTAHDPADGSPVVVHLAHGGSRAYAGYRGAYDWMAGLVDAPRFTNLIGFDDTGWTGGAVPSTAALTFAPSSKDRATRLAGLSWTDAAVTIWSGDDRAGQPAWGNPQLVGTVAGVSYTGGAFAFTVADLGAALNKEVLTGRFAGTGGLEGAAAAAGQLKRRSWGRVSNVEARLLDAATNRYEVGDPACPLQGIEAVHDRGSSGEMTFVADAGSPAATLTALLAAAPPAGGGVFAPSIAQFCWWTKPAGPLTVDLRGDCTGGYVETAPEIAARLTSVMAGPAIAGLDASIAARGAPVGLHLDSAETGAQALGRLLSGVSLAWVLTPASQIELRPFTFEGATETVRLIGEPEREKEFRPLRSRRLGYAKNHRVQSDGEISAAVQASDVVYADGQTAAAFKPATAGADRTADTPQGQAADAGLNQDGTVKDNKVSTDAVQTSAVQKIAYSTLSASLSVPRSSTVTVFDFSAVKDRDDSLVEVLAFISGYSGDDLQLYARIYVDGVQQSVGQTQIISDGFQPTANTMTAFAMIPGLGAGPHEYRLDVQNYEPDVPNLVLAAGAVMKATELKVY